MILYKVKNFLRLTARKAGPYKNFDLGLFFFRIIIPLFDLTLTNAWSFFFNKKFTLTISKRLMLPFTAYLYLKPLYSSRGGSTTHADPLANRPIFVALRKNPL